MEEYSIILSAMALVLAFSILMQCQRMSRDVTRIERKLNLILKQMSIPFDDPAVLSELLPERVKELARQPEGKSQAMRPYGRKSGAVVRPRHSEDHKSSLCLSETDFAEPR
ncbi:MAG: hypothetical protein R6V12_07625 [Candidatus Hydrogenedentota bacterium]